MSVSLRFDSAFLVKEVEYNNSEDSVEREIGANGSDLDTFDDYHNPNNSTFSPFVGAGLGYYSIANLDLSITSTTDGDLEAGTSGKFGGMIRAGFNWRKFKLELDYNLIPKSELENFSGETVGTSKNSYIGISFGFFIGGGKWG